MAKHRGLFSIDERLRRGAMLDATRCRLLQEQSALLHFAGKRFGLHDDDELILPDTCPRLFADEGLVLAHIDLPVCTIKINQPRCGRPSFGYEKFFRAFA